MTQKNKIYYPELLFCVDRQKLSFAQNIGIQDRKIKQDLWHAFTERFIAKIKS